MKAILGIVCLQLCLAAAVSPKEPTDKDTATNKDKRDASLLSQGYPVQHNQVQVVPSVEIAAGSYYEQEPQHNYGPPASGGHQQQSLQGEQQQAYYSGQLAAHYGTPSLSYQPISHVAGEVGGHYSSEPQQQQRYVHGGTYGPPTAVLFQSNEDIHQGAQSNSAVASVRPIGTPHYTQSIGSSYSSPNFASVQNVHLPSGSYGAPVVGASLNFAAPTVSHSTTNQGAYSGFGHQSGPSYSSPQAQGVHSYSSLPTQGVHSFSAAPAPVYGVPQFSRQQHHRFGSPYSHSPGQKVQSGFGGGFGGVSSGGFGKHNNPFVHAGHQQSFRAPSTTSPHQYTQFSGHQSGGQSYAPSSFSHSSPAQYQPHATQSYATIGLGHSSLINDGYGSGPSYASGSKGLGHFSSSATHASPAYVHAPAHQHASHQTSYRSKSHAAKSNVFKPSAYLGSTDLSSTSQTQTYVLPSDHSPASTSASSTPYQSHPNYNTIRYSAV